MYRLIMVLGITACLPSGGPAEGTLKGTFAGATIDVTLDADSLYWLERRTSCATRNQDIFALHYGGGVIEIYFQLDGGSTILGDRTFSYPQATDSGLVWLGVAPASAELSTATIKARISGILARRTGELALAFTDGSMLDATYDMPYEVKGERSDCGDGLDVPDDD